MPGSTSSCPRASSGPGWPRSPRTTSGSPSSRSGWTPIGPATWTSRAAWAAPGLLLIAGRQHDPGDEQRHLRRHLLGPPRLPTADDGIARLRALLGGERHYAPVLAGFERDRPGTPGPGGRGGVRGGSTRRPTSSSGRATSSSSSTSSARWCNPTSTASRARSPGSSRSARPRASRCAACARRCVLHLVLPLLAHAAGSRAVLRARTWPRITRYDDRWPWIVTSVVPRFRRFDADTRPDRRAACDASSTKPAPTRRPPASCRVHPSRGHRRGSAGGRECHGVGQPMAESHISVGHADVAHRTDGGPHRLPGCAEFVSRPW